MEFNNPLTFYLPIDGCALSEMGHGYVQTRGVERVVGLCTESNLGSLGS